jgi:hypothetical protein
MAEVLVMDPQAKPILIKIDEETREKSHSI